MLPVASLTLCIHDAVPDALRIVHRLLPRQADCHIMRLRRHEASTGTDLKSQVQVLCGRLIKRCKFDTSYKCLARRARRANNVWRRLVLRGSTARRLFWYGECRPPAPIRHSCGSACHEV